MCTGRRWSSARAGRWCASVRALVEPQIQPLIGFPQAWSSGTKGPVTADVVRVQIASEADFEKYRGKLAGKIVLAQPARAVRMLEGPIILRMTDDCGSGARPSHDAGASAPAGAAPAPVEAAAAFRQQGCAVLQGRRGRRRVRSRQRQRHGGGRQRSVVAAAASRRRDDFPRHAARATTTPAPACRWSTLAVEHYNRMVACSTRTSR